MEDNVYLTAVRMYNCQSHSNTLYTFLPNKVNVIFGDNSVGKSVFFKMLKASLNPKSFQEKDREDLIRKKAEFAQIQYLFSDNSTAACRIYKKGFIFQYQDSPQSEKIITNEPHEKFLEKLNILMDNDSGFITNIIDGDNDRLLVNSNLKSNYHFLKIIMNSEELERLLEKLPMQVNDALRMKDNLNSKLNYVNQRLNIVQYVDEGKLRSEIEIMEACNNTLYKVIDIYKNLQTIESVFTEKKDFATLLRKTETLLKIVKITERITELQMVEPYNPQTLDMCENLLKLMQVVDHINKLKAINSEEYGLYEIVLQILPVLEQIQNLRVVDDAKNYDYCVEVLDAVLLVIDQLSKVSVVEKVDYDEKLKCVDLVNFLTRITDYLQEVDVNTKQVREAKEQYDTLLQKIKESNVAVHCPIHGEVIFSEQKCLPIT